MTFVDHLSECDRILSPDDRASLRYLFSTLVAPNKLEKQEYLVFTYNELGREHGIEAAQSYMLYVLNHASCYEQRTKMEATGVCPQPPFIAGDRFFMHEEIVRVNKELLEDQFSRLVSNILAHQHISHEENFPAKDPVKRMEFFTLLENEAVLRVDNYQQVLGMALESVQRKDLSRQLQGSRIGLIPLTHCCYFDQLFEWT